MNVLDAARDKNLFAPLLGAGPEAWRHWFSAPRVLSGLPLGERDAECVERCTGRAASTMPADGFATALFLTGRRSGESRTAAVVGAYEAALGGHEGKLAKGERGVVAICAPRTAQGRIVMDYLRAAFEAPLLKAEVARETPEGFELRSGTRIEVMAGDFRTVRGFTLLACVIDEAAFFGYEAESKVKSDAELVRAVRPALATTGGKLVCVTSPYAKKGGCYGQFRKHFGVSSSKVLAWNAPSRAMNPTLPQSVVDDALADDLQAGKSEYLAEFRDDVAEFLPRHIVEAVVVKGRVELPPAAGVRYSAFADLSGGRSDDATLAVGHREGAVVVADALRRYKAPCDPYHVVALMAGELRRFGLARVTGDNYAADFVAGAFGRHGVRYHRCLKPKSALYLQLLPRLCAGGVELPDSPDLVAQLCGLERRTRSGGRDSIDRGRTARATWRTRSPGSPRRRGRRGGAPARWTSPAEPHSEQNMPFIESADEFHARHGGRCVEVLGVHYYADGATAEASPYGFRREPPSDPFEHAKLVAVYWRVAAAAAAEEFSRAQQQAVWAVRGTANGGYSPPRDGFAAVTKARDEARCRQAQLAEAEAELARATPPEDARRLAEKARIDAEADRLVEKLMGIKL